MHRRKRITGWQTLAALTCVMFFAYGAAGPEMLAAVRSMRKPPAPPPTLPPPRNFPPSAEPVRHTRNPKAVELEQKFKEEFSKEFESAGVAVYEVDDDLNLNLLVYHKMVEIATVDQQAAFLLKVARMWSQYAPGSQVTVRDFKTGAILGSMKAEGEKKVVNPPKEPKKPKEPGKPPG